MLDEERLPGTMEDGAIRQAVEELMVLSKRDMEREIYEGREKQRRDENARMRHALQQGMQQGIQQGMQEGMQQGELIGQILLLQPLIGEAATARPALESMSLEELQQIRDRLKQQLTR